MADPIQEELPLDPQQLAAEHSESIDAYMQELEAYELAAEVLTATKAELKHSTHIEFASLETITREHNPEAGALLLNLHDGKQAWFPKKLCRNLDMTAKTVWVWNKFLEREHPKLLEEYGDV